MEITIFKKTLQASSLTNPKFLAAVTPIAIYVLITIENVKLYFSQIDAFLYLGYAINYVGLQNHWGHTYAASRLSTILPIMLREIFAISEQIWRIGLISIVSLSLYVYLLRRTVPAKAFLISIAVTNSVWLMDHLSDDMNFGYAIVYMAAALATFDRGTSMVDRKKRIKYNIWTGVLVALTLNSHFIYLFVVFPFYFGIKLAQRRNISKQATEILYIGIGFIIAYVLILIYSIHLSGLTGIYNHLILLKQIFVNSGDNGRIWTKPILSFFPFAFIIFFIPILAMIKLKAIQSLTKDHDFAFAFGTFLVGVTSICYHFIEGGPILSITRYCSIYLAPILFITAILLVESRIWLILFAILLEVFLILVVQIMPNWQSTEKSISFLRILIIAPIFLLITYSRFNFKKAKIGLATLLIVAALPITQSWGTFAISTSSRLNFNGEYHEFLRTMNQGDSIDQQNFAEIVAKSVKSELPPTFYGWTLYPVNPSWLGAIDSAQLWGYSCYKCMDAGIPIERQYPLFSPIDIVELQKRDYLLIFDTSLTRFNELKMSILESSPNFTEGKRHVVIGKSNVLYFQYILTGFRR